MSEPTLQNTQSLPDMCWAIVDAVATVIGAEPPTGVRPLRLPNGQEVGRQIMIDATQADGLMNRCRMMILNADLTPMAEAARIEYEHDKQGKFGVRRVYSVQSVRRERGIMTLVENFLAEDSRSVREEDFRPITSAEYARQTVLKSVQDWANYRAWQLRTGAKH
jgi:hypothetical protein